jgi:hypothetical protein
MGGVGLNLAQAASMVSANPIIGIDIKCVSRSVNGYLTYLRNIGDLDKSINHFFELKQKINEPKIKIWVTSRCIVGFFLKIIQVLLWIFAAEKYCVFKN